MARQYHFHDIINKKVAVAQAELVDATFLDCKTTPDTEEAFRTLEFANNLCADLNNKQSVFTTSIRDQIYQFYIFLRANGWANNEEFARSFVRISPK